MRSATNQRPILCIGTATLDIISLLPAYPKANDRVLAAEMVLSGGGPAATAAVTLSRLGHYVEMITAVGDDDQGQFVLEGLAKEGVGISNITVVKNGRTATSQVIVSSESAERLIVHRPGTLVEESLKDFEFDVDATWIHIDNRGYEALENSGKRQLAFRNHKISLDGGIPIDDIDLTNVDLYVPTISELNNVFGVFGQPLSIVDALISAKRAGAEVVVATDGSNGSYSLSVPTGSGNQSLVHSPAFEGGIFSTLGAGDVFHGALLSEFIHGSELKIALRRANLCAFKSCEALDGRSSVPSAEELNALFSLQQAIHGESIQGESIKGESND